MKKLKEIVYLILDALTAIFSLFVAVCIPFGVVTGLIETYDAMEIERFSLVKQIIFVMLLLWIIDVLARPVISRLINNGLSGLGRVFIIQPSDKKEGIEDARHTATATAKDA